MHKLTKEDLDKIKYFNPHLHSHYSLLDGIGTVSAHIKKAHACGHAGCAITDHGTMASAIELYQKTRDPDFLKNELKTEEFPGVPGCELYITRDALIKDKENKYNHITVLTKNYQGYKNLCFLTSIGSSPDHHYFRPRCSMEELKNNKEGLIATSGCVLGMIPQAILKKTGKEEELALEFLEIFGEDFYIELHFSDISHKWNSENKTYEPQGFNPQEIVNKRLLELSEKFKIKCLIAQDAHMPNKEDHAIQTIMIANSPSGKDGWHFREAYYTRTVHDMYEQMKQTMPFISDQQFIDYCQNTIEVLNKCKGLKMEFKPILPKVKYDENPVNQDPKYDEILNNFKAVFQAIDKEFSDLIEYSEKDISLRTALKCVIKNEKIDLLDDKYRERIKQEIDIIQFNGRIKLMDYFLILEDVSRKVTESGFLRGYGRGSGAGSLLCYALDITDCDSLEYSLLFERFLTRSRIGNLNFDLSEAISGS